MAVRERFCFGLRRTADADAVIDAARRRLQRLRHAVRTYAWVVAIRARHLPGRPGGQRTR